VTKTEEIVVWLALEPDGSEGIMAMHDPGTGMMMPLFATRGGPTESLMDDKAGIIARTTGRTCRKVAFRRDRELETIDGR
jgi:hypothetical protein